MQVDFTDLRKPGSSLKAGSYYSGHIDLETPWHYHDMHQLMYAFEGSVEVEGESARYKVPHQFAAWIPAGTVHRTAIQRVRSGSVFFSPNMADIAAGSLRVIAANNLMREMILYAMRWSIQSEGDDTSVVFYDCFAKLCAEWVTQEVQLVLPATDNPRINAVAAYTRDNLPAVKLDDVCHAVGMSPRSLRRNFQKYMGISWEEYRLRMRMYAAVEQLDRTSKPIGEIAEYVGYASQPAFSRAFSAFMGMGPGAYRRVSRR